MQSIKIVATGVDSTPCSDGVTRARPLCGNFRANLVASHTDNMSCKTHCARVCVRASLQASERASVTVLMRPPSFCVCIVRKKIFPESRESSERECNYLPQELTFLAGGCWLYVFFLVLSAQAVSPHSWTLLIDHGIDTECSQPF